MKTFKEYTTESVDTQDRKEALQKVADHLKSEYGFHASVLTSTLGGADKTSYALKIFGPKEGWVNGIAQNSPVQFIIWAHSGTDALEMHTMSYELKNKGMKKMRKAKYKTDADITKKLMTYFNKNSSILAEFKA